MSIATGLVVPWSVSIVHFTSLLLNFSRAVTCNVYVVSSVILSSLVSVQLMISSLRYHDTVWLGVEGRQWK